jgi:FAD/FMN-containing dehydrogenase
VLDLLRTAIRGRLIEPVDPDYEKARMPFYGGIDKRPLAIVRAADAQDVAATVSFARDQGLELAVRGGGHSVAGHSVSDGGIVLDLGDMKGLEIDVEGRTLWAEAGLTAAEITTAAGEHGLAIGFGDTGSVGVGGITLGGGVGFLTRKFGMTIDSLLGAEIVTADGKIRPIDAETEPDLFWAIRGGGGNFGVVTRFHFQLQELPEIVGGMLFLPASAEVVAGFIAAAEAAPDELSTIANVMVAPPMPFIPEEHHGSLIVMAFITYAGGAQDGEAAIAPFRALAPPLADMVRPMTYPEMYMPEEEGYHPIATGRNMFIDSVDLDTAAAILERLQTSTAMAAVAQLRVLGGAMARVPRDATAFAHRDRRIMVNLAALYPSLEDRPKHEPWVNDFMAMLQVDEPAVYVNFLDDEGPERIRQAYPAGTWERLVEIKNRYDPTNLFRLNQNIPPSV